MGIFSAIKEKSSEAAAFIPAIPSKPLSERTFTTKSVIFSSHKRTGVSDKRVTFTVPLKAFAVYSEISFMREKMRSASLLSSDLIEPSIKAVSGIMFGAVPAEIFPIVRKVL